MESLITLQYPNGRSHETQITTPGVLTPGDEFALHGRRWRVEASRRSRRISSTLPDRALCVTAQTH